VSVRRHLVRRGAEVAHDEGGAAVEREAVDRTAAWSARPWTGQRHGAPGVDRAGCRALLTVDREFPGLLSAAAPRRRHKCAGARRAGGRKR
jgi:hypothetical protein